MSKQKRVGEISIKEKQARVSLWLVAIFSVLLAVSFMYFVFAAHVIVNSNLAAGFNYSVLEDRGYVYNISVNSTESQNNITEVNITLPAGFILRDPEIWAGAVNLSYINGTPATSYTFRNTTTNLSFSGGNLIIGNSTGVTAMFFWFNASAATPGEYNLTITVVNVSGVVTNTTLIRVAVNDTTNPLVTITNPVAKNYSATTIDFNISTNENSTCWVSLNSGLNNVSMTANASGTGFNHTNNSIVNGAYTARYYCNDTQNGIVGAGNWNRTETRTFGMDTAVPGVSIVSPTNITYVGTNTSIRFNVSTTEAATSCFYSLNGGLNNVSMISNDTATNVGWNATNTSIADGGYLVRIYCNDSADNWNRTESRAFSLDTTPPLITIISPAATNYSVTALDFNVSTNENATCAYSLNGGLNNVSMTRNATDTVFNATNASIANNNAYTVNFYCNDTNGNWNRTVSRGFGTDTAVPGVSIVNPANTTYNTTSILFNISITETATSCLYSLNGGLNNNTMSANNTQNVGFNATNTSIADGGYLVRFYCNDSADNWNRTESRAFSKDATPPLVTIIYPDAARNYSVTSIEFNVSTNENATCNYTLDGGLNNNTMTRNATDTGFNRTNGSIANGAYTLNVYCYDTQNNWNRTVSSVFGTDNVNPGVSVVSPANSTFTAGNTSIRINVSTTEAAVSCSYSLNGGLNNVSMSSNDSTVNRGWNATNTSIADGGYLINFYCNDSANNWNRTTTREFSIDRTAPGITILSPSVSRNYSATSILFNLSTSENATCLYSLDSGLNNVSMQRNATDTGYNHTNNSIVNGAYTVNFYCNDTNGNWNRSMSRAFITDTVAPALTFSCTPASVLQGNTVTCTCSGTDTTSGLNISYGVNGLSYTTNPPTTSSGTQTTTCSSVDYAGNTVSLSTTYTVEVSGGGGGGGGGGGTTSAATVTKTLDSESKVITIIVEATPVTVTITKSDSLGVSEIVIESTEKLENVKVSVDKLAGQPAAVSTAPVAAGGGSGVYSYLKIEAPKASGKIKDADITFDVKKSWINEKGINARDVVLQRYTTKWEELPTTLISENSEKATYKATTPGFSFFAVTAKSNVTAVTPATNATKEAAPAKEGAGEAAKVGISAWVWVIVVLAVIVIILVSIKAAAKKSR